VIAAIHGGRTTARGHRRKDAGLTLIHGMSKVAVGIVALFAGTIANRHS